MSLSYKTECNKQCYKSILCLSSARETIVSCPCKICIVNSMCTKRCEIFVDFIGVNLSDEVFNSKTPIYELFIKKFIEK